jgi:phage baseplate assembly protein gpV
MFPLKKILLIILFIAFAAGAGYGIYYFFFRPAPAEEIVEEYEEYIPPSGLPGAGGAKPKPAEAEIPAGVSLIAKGGLTYVSTLTDGNILGATMSDNGRTMSFYNKADGKFYRLTPAGDITQIGNKTFYNVEDVSWSPDSAKAVLEYPDGSNIIYDFASEKQITLPKHWEEFEFSPDSEKIAAKSMDEDPDNRWLVTVNSDGTGTQPIELLGNNANKVQIAYSPTGQVVAFSSTGEAQGFSRQDILLLGLNGENFKALRVNGLGFEGKWSTGGERLLYSVYNSDSEYKPVIWITDAAGDNIGTNRRNLGLNTWTDKCAFFDDFTLYCAVPQTMDRGIGFQPKLANKISDVFYRIDIRTGLKTLLAIPSGQYTAKDLMVSADEQFIFFTNANTGAIEKIQLK